MKAPLEDFLIPFDSALARVCPAGQPEDIYVGKAVELRLRIAIKAQQEHEEKLQQLADQWVKERLEKIEEAVEHSGKETQTKAIMLKGQSFLGSYEYQHMFRVTAVALRCRLWGKMRDSAPEIFRDLIQEEPPRQGQEASFTAP
jgi:hypothetical protein